MERHSLQEDKFMPTPEIDSLSSPARDNNDVFGSEENHQIKYKTLTWPLVTVLMITEIVRSLDTRLYRAFL